MVLVAALLLRVEGNYVNTTTGTLHDFRGWQNACFEGIYDVVRDVSSKCELAPLRIWTSSHHHRTHPPQNKMLSSAASVSSSPRVPPSASMHHPNYLSICDGGTAQALQYAIPLRPPCHARFNSTISKTTYSFHHTSSLDLPRPQSKLVLHKILEH